jgi:hypothetical protein
MRQVLPRGLLLLAMMVFADLALAQQGALTVPRDLRQLTDRAAHIVRGNVVSARMARHPELDVQMLVVTMRVRETLKGRHQDTFTFRQYVWDRRDPGKPAAYLKGDDVLLLMIAPSRYGLSSPAGLGQGSFRIVRAADGREMAVNGHGNARLFEGLQAQATKDGIALSPASLQLLQRQPQGPVDARGLMDLIRAFASRSR